MLRLKPFIYRYQLCIVIQALREATGQCSFMRQVCDQMYRMNNGKFFSDVTFEVIPRYF